MGELRLISAECAKEHLVQDYAYAAAEIIDAVPTIDLEELPIVQELRRKLAEREPKHGHWIKFSRCDKCSCCGYETSRSEYGGNYCKMCGAEMSEEV